MPFGGGGGITRRSVRGPLVPAAGDYTINPMGSGGAEDLGYGNDKLIARPVFLYGGSINSGSFQVTTAGEAACTVRLGIYKADAARGQPGTLVKDFGTSVADTTGVKVITPGAAAVIPQDDWYWEVSVGNGMPTTRPFCRMVYSDGQLPFSTLDLVNGQTALKVGSITGALAGTCPALTAVVNQSLAIGWHYSVVN